MRPDLLNDLYEKEGSYWWNVTKRETVFSLLEGTDLFGSRKGRGLAVDIGCGAGYTAMVFQSYFRTVGVDVSREALRFSRDRGLRRLCQINMDEFSLPFKSDCFDLVLALDVVEHVEDDVRALRECGRILRDGGLLVVTVPAFMALWSPWDEALGHRRRYNAAALADAAQKAGLSVKKLSYLFFFVFPMAVLIRTVKRYLQRNAMRYSSDFIPIPSALNSLLIQIGRLEQWSLTRLNLNFPWGLSVISVMTKKC